MSSSASLQTSHLLSSVTCRWNNFSLEGRASLHARQAIIWIFLGILSFHNFCQRLEIWLVFELSPTHMPELLTINRYALLTVKWPFLSEFQICLSRCPAGRKVTCIISLATRWSNSACILTPSHHFVCAGQSAPKMCWVHQKDAFHWPANSTILSRESYDHAK